MSCCVVCSYKNWILTILFDFSLLFVTNSKITSKQCMSLAQYFSICSWIVNTFVWLKQSSHQAPHTHTHTHHVYLVSHNNNWTEKIHFSFFLWQRRNCCVVLHNVGEPFLFEPFAQFLEIGGCFCFCFCFDFWDHLWQCFCSQKAIHPINKKERNSNTPTKNQKKTTQCIFFLHCHWFENHFLWLWQRKHIYFLAFLFILLFFASFFLFSSHSCFFVFCDVLVFVFFTRARDFVENIILVLLLPYFLDNSHWCTFQKCLCNLFIVVNASPMQYCFTLWKQKVTTTKFQQKKKKKKDKSTETTKDKKMQVQEEQKQIQSPQTKTKKQKKLQEWTKKKTIKQNKTLKKQQNSSHCHLVCSRFVFGSEMRRSAFVVSPYLMPSITISKKLKLIFDCTFSDFVLETEKECLT